MIWIFSDRWWRGKDSQFFGVSSKHRVLNLKKLLTVLYPNPETKRLRTNKNRILLVMGSQISVDFSIPPLQKNVFLVHGLVHWDFGCKKHKKQLFRWNFMQKLPQFHTQNCHRSLALYLDSPLVGLFYILLEAMLTPSEGKAMLIYQINHWKLPVQKPLSYKASKTNKWWRWHSVQQKVKWCTTCYGKRKTSWICRDWPTFESFQSKARWKAFSEATGKHQQIHVFRPKSIQKKCNE